jgi:hypothetical protein
VHVFEKISPDVREILSKPIRDLGLRLDGSPLERFVQQLYLELDRKGLRKFRPVCYLTDEWGCPSGEPVIGIPFYLANPQLARLEKEMNDLEDAREIMMYMRHEAGHAFNYAYELYKSFAWRELFGPFRRSYRDSYRPVPFSRQYVRHIAGWYAQKHPDEDFAETFAVWLTPGSQWRKRYQAWGALAKLKYVDRIARSLANTIPTRTHGRTDITVEQMDSTVAEFYQRSKNEEPSIVDLALDPDLIDIFNVSRRRKRMVRQAAELIHEHRKALIDKIAYWTGVQRPLIKKLLELIEMRVRALGLRADAERETEHLTELVVYATALAMNYVARGKFVLS